MVSIHYDTKTSWRNHQRIKFLKEFYLSRKLVRVLLEEYERTGHIPHETIDNILEVHFRSLKDISHVLYRTPDNENTERKKQRLFDKILGEMWHELDKSRDNIRLIEAYSDSLTKREGIPKDEMWRSLSRLEDQILKAAHRDLPQQIKRVKQLMDQLVPLFEKILPVYRDNEIILRSLYFSREFFDSLCSPSTIEYFYPLLFESVAEGYLTLIQSLIRTKHLDQAEQALSELRSWVSSHPEFQDQLVQAESELQKTKE